MKQITLSDHTNDKVQEARQQRADENARRQAIYQQQIEHWRASIAEAATLKEQAWRQRRFLAWMRHALRKGWRSVFHKPRSPAEVTQMTSEERIWESGHEGEMEVAKFLGARLSDDWTLVHGYKNRGGEIDQVLVGPLGLFTIEIKNLNGTVHVHGDTWTLDKYDRYGNLVEKGKVVGDKSGRSPSRQLNESTERMLEFLCKSLPAVVAMRIVVLAHDRSAIAEVANATALPVVLHTWSLEETLQHSRAPLMPSEQTTIIELLQRDHAHNTNRTKQRNQPSNGLVPNARRA